MAKKYKMGSGQVLTAIETMWPPPAWAWFYEVSDATGFKASRRADAVGVSCYPSRGLFARIIEVKVDRADWRNELKNPEKSENFHRNASDFYLAAPAGVVMIDEVPETWGYIEVKEGGKAKVLKKAPFTEKTSIEWDFAASLLRHAAKNYEKKSAKLAEKARLESPDYAQIKDLTKQLRDAQFKLTNIQGQMDLTTSTLKRYREIFAEFYRKTGLRIQDGRWPHYDLNLVQALRTLESREFKVDNLIDSCQTLLDGLKKVTSVKDTLGLKK